MENQTDLSEYFTAQLPELKKKIEGNFFSVAAFSRQKGFDRHHLSNVLNGHKKLSVGLFLRLGIALGEIESNVVSAAQQESTTPLDEYLRLPYQAICIAIVKMTTN